MPEIDHDALTQALVPVRELLHASGFRNACLTVVPNGWGLDDDPFVLECASAADFRARQEALLKQEDAAKIAAIEKLLGDAGTHTEATIGMFDRFGSNCVRLLTSEKARMEFDEVVLNGSWGGRWRRTLACGVDFLYDKDAGITIEPGNVCERGRSVCEVLFRTYGTRVNCSKVLGEWERQSNLRGAFLALVGQGGRPEETKGWEYA